MKKKANYMYLGGLVLLLASVIAFYFSKHTVITLPQDIIECRMKYSDYSGKVHFTMKLTPQDYAKLIASCGKLTPSSCNSKWQYLATFDIQTQKEKITMVVLDILSNNNKALIMIDKKYYKSELSMQEIKTLLLSMRQLQSD